MFHGSLLYLPALMARLILHRLPNEQKEHNIHQTSEIAGVLRGAEESARQKWEDLKPSCAQSRPPVAYSSVALFPFLHVPVYVSPQAHEFLKLYPSSQAAMPSSSFLFYVIRKFFLALDREFSCPGEFLFVLLKSENNECSFCLKQNIKFSCWAHVSIK
uniref:Uncharacterized protein n=1 Tax=Triticum urartu TaxID=4572 RepID=A0A8R7V200_TRIUA